MKAIDTCVLARFVLNDDAHQGEVAGSIVKRGGYVSLTVLLELSWLLRSRFGFKRQELSDILRDLVEISSLRFEKEDGLEWAIDRISAGADVAHVIHLVAAGNVEAFVTFDDMVAQVGTNAPVAVEILS